MKSLICVLLVIFCLSTTNFAQKVKKPTVKKPVLSSQSVLAEKAWIPFYEQFRSVIKMRNRQGLYDLMAPDFRFPCAYDGGYGDQGEGVGRSFEIKKFDGPTQRGFDCGGWETLLSLKKESRLLRKGETWQAEKYLTKIVGEKWYDNGKEVSACQDSKNDPNTCGWDSAVFQFRDGKWYLAFLDFCECE